MQYDADVGHLRKEDEVRHRSGYENIGCSFAGGGLVWKRGVAGVYDCMGILNGIRQRDRLA